MSNWPAFFVIFLVALDVLWSIIALHAHGANFHNFRWQCERCGGCERHAAFSIVAWKIVTHRCDDHLT